MSSNQLTTINFNALNTDRDWKQWWNYIALAAKKRDVFKYVDIEAETLTTPSISSDSSTLRTNSLPHAASRAPIEPKEPEYTDVKAFVSIPAVAPDTEGTTRPPTYSDLDTDEREQLRRLQARYDKDFKQYEKERIGLVDLRLLIQSSVDAKHHMAYLLHTDDCFTVLMKLKERFKPTGDVEIDRLGDEWEALCATNRLTISYEEWIQQWETCYNDCIAAKLGVVHGAWPVKCFLKAVGRITPAFTHSIKIEQSDPTRPTIDFPTILQRYHLWTRSEQLPRSNRSGRNAVYTTKNPDNSTAQSDEKPSNTPVPTLNQKDKENRRREPKPCICGEHIGWSHCPYLFEWLRPVGWKPDVKVEKLVKEKMQTKGIRNTVKTLRETLLRRRREEGKDTSSLAESSSRIHGFPSSYATWNPLLYSSYNDATPRTSFDPSVYSNVSTNGIHFPLLHSYILDTGATQHVCNDRSRFTEFIPTREDDILIAGATIVKIEGIGQITIEVNGDVAEDTTTGKRKLSLTNVAYIPTFTTNVVSYNSFHQKRLFFDGRNERLEYNGITISKLLHQFGQWTLEYHQNLAGTAYPAVPSHAQRRKVKWSTHDAHQKMGHVYAEALQHLPTACSDIESVTGTLDSCEVCKIHDAKRIISRREGSRADRPFYRLCVDFIPMRDGYIAHIYDDYLGYHWVELVYSTEAPKLIQPIKRAVNNCKRQWKLEVAIIRIDNQMSLLDSNEWDLYVDEAGLEIELSAPDVHEQNGAAEVSGGVLTRRSAKLKTTGNLPEKLLPELYRAAAYIQNRTPSRRLKWDSPLGHLQKLVGKSDPLPKLSHLRVYGCKAYALKYHMNKLDRLESRVHIGYLVGYESTNIFKVWVPSLSKVISVRDVTFDESQRYSPSDDVSEAIQETVKAIELNIDENVEETDFETESPTRSWERSIDALNDTIVVETGVTDVQNSVDTVIPTRSQQLLTPEQSPQPENQDISKISSHDSREISTNKNSSSEPTDPNAASLTSDSNVNNNTKENIYSKSTTTSLDKSAVFDWNKRVTRRHRREETRDAHANTLSNLHYDSAYHIAFAYGVFNEIDIKLHRSAQPDEPETWNEMLIHPYRKEWLKAVEVEYQELLRRKTFEVVASTDAPGFAIPTRFVFRYKHDDNGFVNKFKARLVVRGDLQPMKGEDTYAATLGARVFRCLMAIAAYFDLEAMQFDAINAFTNARLPEPIWVRFPTGYGIPGKLLKLVMALYGLRTSPLLWYEHLCKIMRKLGLKPVPECACLFQSNKLILFFYVDDIVILFHASDRQFYDEFIIKLMTRVDLRPIGSLEWFLGIRVLRDRSQRKIWLCQDSYLEKIGRKFELHHRIQKVPISPTLELVKYDGVATPREIHDYQTRVGSVGYPVAISRPDCASALQKLSQFLQNPGPTHLLAVNQCIAYLYCTRHLALQYDANTALSLSSPHFLAASDSSLADDRERRWSTEGSLFQLFGGCIDWSSALQRTVSTSSTEAELLALSHICAWLFWWRRLFDQVELDLDSDVTVHCDNLQTVRLMMKESPKLVTKLKHVDIHQHWLRQEAEKGTVKIEWISTSDMPADGLTKSLGPQKHQAFVKQLRLVDISARLANIRPETVD